MYLSERFEDIQDEKAKRTKKSLLKMGQKEKLLVIVISETYRHQQRFTSSLARSIPKETWSNAIHKRLFVRGDEHENNSR